MSLTIQQHPARVTLIAATALSVLLACTTLAQNGRPDPQKPQRQTAPPADAVAAAQDDAPPVVENPQPVQEQPATVPNGNGTGNQIIGPVRLRQSLPGKVTLAFNDAPVDEKIVGFIADSTGKVVIPINLPTLKTKKITLINEEPIERSAALDLVLTALRLNGVGISETDEVIVMDDIQNLRQKPVPVVTADMDIMNRTDRGNFIVKIYRLRQASAEGVHERLTEVVPDYATLSVDPNSNQLILYGDVGLAQHFQKIIDELDHVHVTVKWQTFRLAYADATAVSQQIYDLFEPSATAGQTQPGAPRTQRQPRPTNRGAPGAVQASPSGISTPGPVVELRVSVNVQQNSVTVGAEPEKVDAIAKLIHEEWDVPRPKETFRVYVLEHTDPIKMRDLILNLMGQGGGGSRSTTAGRTQTARAGQPAGGAGGQSAISDVIGDIYRVEAFSDRNSIVVLSKTKEALDYLNEFILANDQPSYIGLPHVVELKHANAVSLADELNVLLAESGTGGSLVRPGSGLSAEGPGGFSDSGTNGGTTGGSTTRGGTGANGTGGAQGGNMEFPWQRSRPRDDQSEPSPLIGKVRIVPIVRQNALAVLAPISQRAAVVELIRQFDRPGRQVMISAIIAEVQLGNDLALGLRLSSSAISPTQADNAITGTIGFEGTTNNLLTNLFDTSVLDVGADVNLLIQALRQKTNVRIIQEPRVFTADNEEAAFFDGQQIPFITNSVVNSQVNGGVTQSFDYKKVGVLLNVRPRITVQRDVDMEIRLALSAVVPGQTLFGGAILDLRETTTKVIVKNAQTIVLSGLLKDLDSKTTRGLPLLSELPLIGDLFKSHETTKTTSELIAFITPIVVDNPSENDENFNRLERENLRDLSLPLKDQSKDQKHQRDRIRDKILAPKTPAGEPIPEALPSEEAHSTSNQPAPPPVPARPEPQPAPPPVDVDELEVEPSS